MTVYAVALSKGGSTKTTTARSGGRTMREALTEFQAAALFIVAQNEPTSVSDLTHHLPVSSGAARSRLNTLERRGLITRTYTGHHRGSQFAYTLTATGRDALSKVDASEAKDGICDLCDRPFESHSRFCMSHPDKVAARQRARSQPTGQEQNR